MRHIVLFLILSCNTTYTQLNIDSLLEVWNDENEHDTVRLEAMFEISWKGYLFTQPDSAFYYAQLQYEFAKNKGLKKQMAVALNTQGVSFAIRGDYISAEDHFKQCLSQYEELKDKKGIAGALGNLGTILMDKGDYARAIDCYTRGLKIKEEIGDTAGIASSLIHIGIINVDQGDDSSAVEYYTRALAIYEDVEDEKGTAGSLNNIGTIYEGWGDFSKAMEYYSRSLSIREKMEDNYGVAGALNNIGNIFREQLKYDSAMDYCTRSLKIRADISDKQGTINSQINIALIYRDKNNHSKAIEFGRRALGTALEIGFAVETKDAAEILYKEYSTIGNYKSALEMHELYIMTRDGIASDKNQREVISQKFKYEYDKRTLADSLDHLAEQEKAVLILKEKDARLSQEETEKIGYRIGGALALLLAILAVFAFVSKRKDNKLIHNQKIEAEHQKEVVEEKNKEITDSITYAKRIQKAILPPTRLVEKWLPDSFVLYKPKDIVAGDFYWLEAIDDTVIFAAADCTGHGVPGAMVSVVCHNAMNRAVREFGLREPGKILDKVNELVEETFVESDEEVKDGMDLALCSLKGDNLQYSGAHNPLWIIRNGEILETKADKLPIGSFNVHKPYVTHSMELLKGDNIYIFSDGYVDQFGGEKGKKFKPSNFRKLLLSIQNEPMVQQKDLLDDAFENWRGNLEQIDDVCVLGVRI